MKKVYYVLLTIVQALLFSGIYILNYFTKKKLGMNRWVAYHNLQLDKNSIVKDMRYVLPILAVITTIFFVKKCSKLKQKRILKNIDVILLVVLTILLATIILILNAKLVKLYYFYVILFMFIYLLQSIKLLLQIV